MSIELCLKVAGQLAAGQMAAVKWQRIKWQQGKFAVGSFGSGQMAADKWQRGHLAMAKRKLTNRGGVENCFWLTSLARRG